jgi:ABC-type enterochelin transport system ATPase subunit
MIELLNERKDVKIEVTLKDLISFTDYLLNKGRINSDSEHREKEF